jgi:inorganic pyrophosphatase
MGDNDPVDVVEIGSKALAMGSVTTVRLYLKRERDR